MNWIFIRGLAREVRHWGDFVQKFESKFPQSKVYCLELPGVGDKRNLNFPYTIKECVKELRKEFVLNLKNKDESNSILGISMGGMIAHQWCDLYPEDFKSLVLINTSAGNASLPWKRMKLQAVLQSLKIFLEKNVVKREELILSMVSNVKIKDEVLKSWVAYANEKPMSKSNFIRQILAAARYKAPTQVFLKTLILNSIEDHMVDPECSVDLFNLLKQNNFNLKLTRHPNAGHDLPLDDPDWVIECIQDFQ